MFKRAVGGGSKHGFILCTCRYIYKLSRERAKFTAVIKLIFSGHLFEKQ